MLSKPILMFGCRTLQSNSVSLLSPTMMFGSSGIKNEIRSCLICWTSSDDIFCDLVLQILITLAPLSEQKFPWFRVSIPSMDPCSSMLSHWWLMGLEGKKTLE